jgi:hypothetical protein
MLVDGCGEVGARWDAVGGGAVDDAEGSRTGSKPVPSDGSPSVPSPSFSFSASMALIKSVSKAKFLMEDAIVFDISHGENAAPERVC